MKYFQKGANIIPVYDSWNQKTIFDTNLSRKTCLIRSNSVPSHEKRLTPTYIIKTKSMYLCITCQKETPKYLDKNVMPIEKKSLNIHKTLKQRFKLDKFIKVSYNGPLSILEKYILKFQQDYQINVVLSLSTFIDAILHNRRLHIRWHAHIQFKCIMFKCRYRSAYL